MRIFSVAKMDRNKQDKAPSVSISTPGPVAMVSVKSAKRLLQIRDKELETRHSDLRLGRKTKQACPLPFFFPTQAERHLGE